MRNNTRILYDSRSPAGSTRGANVNETTMPTRARNTGSEDRGITGATDDGRRLRWVKDEKLYGAESYSEGN